MGRLDQSLKWVICLPILSFTNRVKGRERRNHRIFGGCGASANVALMYSMCTISGFGIRRFVRRAARLCAKCYDPAGFS